ncbi:MAG: tetratricopeptide repeat protein [Pseudomonadota bacterium]
MTRKNRPLLISKPLLQRTGKAAVVALLHTGAITLVAGCAATPDQKGPPTLREAHRLESAVTGPRMVGAPHQALEDLHRALRLYALVDDRPGQIRSHLAVARLQEQMGRKDSAQDHARMALQLARQVNIQEHLYRALLAVGRMENNRAFLEEALEHAGSALERAVAYSYLGRHREAFALVHPLSRDRDDADAADLAFVVHAYADERMDPAAAAEALALYKQVDHYTGIIDCLRLLGRISAGNGDHPRATLYYDRALRAAQALGDTARMQAIQAERDAP